MLVSISDLILGGLKLVESMVFLKKIENKCEGKKVYREVLKRERNFKGGSWDDIVACRVSKRISIISKNYYYYLGFRSCG